MNRRQILQAFWGGVIVSAVCGVVLAQQVEQRESFTYGGVEYFLPAPRSQIVFPPNIPATHTVVRGNTLWGIARQHLQNPFLWPLVWEANLEAVPNPHLIYPGQELQLLSGTVVPSAPGTGAGSQPAADILSMRAFQPPPPPDAPEYRRGGYAFEDMFDPHAPRPAANHSTIHTAGFIGPRNFSGPQIVDAELAYPDLTETDVVYINAGSIDGVTPGAIYEIVRSRRTVRHPKTDSKLGNLMEQVGRIRMVCVQESTAIAVITKAYTSVYRGDYVVPFQKRSAVMTTGSPDTDVCEPARGDLLGIIVDAKKGGFETADAVLLSSGDVVYLDVGRTDGVQEGQYFVVFQESRLGRKYPSLQAGELIVLASEDGTATAMITGTRQAMFVGDTVRLK